ncbi:MAG: hypothetical protein FJX22_00645 [Alphaproteobacteria bacterium]|nr:hypothetical protein [Alphaproteobacteria bacterium]
MTEKDIIVKQTLSEIKAQMAAGRSQTRPDAPEGEALSKEFWERAQLVMPPSKTSVHLRLDSDVFEWFKRQGAGHLTRMNAVLRTYVEAHKKTP